jgi:hypothetical protein
MSHVTIAAVKMDAAPAPLGERLTRAEKLVAECASHSAKVILLPELFNSGYRYTEDGYSLAEPIDGKTFRWMKITSQKYDIHLAGTFLLREKNEIYNSMFLVAPDGLSWRYDKSYPWCWERAIFHENTHGVTIADSTLGRIGMLICWDTSHTDLWARFAGKVDLMLISSCPPLIHYGEVCFPDGKKVNIQKLGPFLRAAFRNADGMFGPLTRRQAAWLGVPVAQATGSGCFSSPLPRPFLSCAVFLSARPDLWHYLPAADKIRLQAGYFNDTYLANNLGEVLQRAEQEGDGFAVGKVDIAAETPHPCKPQPAFGLTPPAYLTDRVVNWQMRKLYRRKINKLGRRRGLPALETIPADDVRGEEDLHRLKE